MRIPLYNKGLSGQLETGQRTKLDREARPRANFSGVEQGIENLGRSFEPAYASDALANPSRALAGLGQDIQRAGGVMAAVEVKRIQAVTDYQTAEADSAMAQASAEFEEWKTRNPDPAGWSEAWGEKLSTLGDQLTSKEGLTGGARENIDLRFERFRGHSAAGVQLGATKQSFARAAESLQVEADRAIEAQDPERLEAVNRMAEEKGYWWEHNSEGNRKAFEQQAEVKQAEMIANARVRDPVGMAEKLRNGEFKLDDYERSRQIQLAEQEDYRQQAHTATGIEDQIDAGEILNVDQIEAAGAGIKPKFIMALKDKLGRMFERETDRIVRTPEEQSRIAGQLEGILSSYKPTGEEQTDADYMSAAGLIESIADPVQQKEYKRRLDAIRSNGFAETDSFEGRAFAALKQVKDDGGFGTIPEVAIQKKTLGAFLDDGFLEDREKLETLGLSSKQAKEIAKADTMAERVKAFKEIYPEREGEDTATEFERKIAETLRDGSGLTTIMAEDEDPLSREAAATRQFEVETAYGRASQELSVWLRGNPKASPEAVLEKVKTLSNGAKASTLKILPSRPDQGLNAAPKKTSAVLKGRMVPAYSSSEGRALRAKQGGATILLDSNWGTGTGATSPMIVIPDNATPLQRSAAQKYVDRVAKIQKEHFGRELKPRVVTRSENGRGRPNAFHTEGFAVHDEEFVAWYQTPAGKDGYAWALEPLAEIPGVQFTLPHGGKKKGYEDTGAQYPKENPRYNEVDLARGLIEHLNR